MTDQKNQYTRKQGRSGQQPLDFSLAHVMPQAPDMEKAVLGAIEQDADMVIFLHRPEYYGLYQSEDGSIDYRGKAEVIISKHRKGAVGIVMMDFKGEYTRFENEEDNRIGNRPPTDGGEIIGSSMNNMPFPPPETPFPNA